MKSSLISGLIWNSVPGPQPPVLGQREKQMMSFPVANWACAGLCRCIKTRNYSNQIKKCLPVPQELDALHGELPDRQEDGGSTWKGGEGSTRSWSERAVAKREEVWNAERRQSQGVRRSSSGQGNEEGRSDWRFVGRGDALSHSSSMCLSSNWPTKLTIAQHVVSTPTSAIPSRLQEKQNKHFYEFDPQIFIEFLALEIPIVNKTKIIPTVQVLRIKCQRQASNTHTLSSAVVSTL